MQSETYLLYLLLNYVSSFSGTGHFAKFSLAIPSSWLMGLSTILQAAASPTHYIFPDISR